MLNTVSLFKCNSIKEVTPAYNVSKTEKEFQFPMCTCNFTQSEPITRSTVFLSHKSFKVSLQGYLG